MSRDAGFPIADSFHVLHDMRVLLKANPLMAHVHGCLKSYDMRMVRQEDASQIAFVLPLPFGVILLRYALAVTLGYKARKTI